MSNENLPKTQADSQEKFDAIKYILARVRDDLHSRRCYSRKNKKWEYYVRPRKEGDAPEPITDEMIVRHVTEPEKVGDVHIGVFPLRAGDETILCAAFDFDNHDGTMDNDEFIAQIKPVIDAARNAGLHPWCVRSGGGAGVHAWFFWDESNPQPADDVRAMLIEILQQYGFKENSGGGVQAKHVEIFPKQVRATIQNPGNLIALPFARKSTWLDSDLTPTNKPTFQITSPSVPVSTVASDIVETDAPQGGADFDVAIDALSHIKPDCGYQTRQKLGMALKNAFGERGFAPWHEWIKTCDDQTSYKGERTHRYHWDSFEAKRDGKVVGIGSLFWYAEKDGWIRPAKKEGEAKLAPLAAAVHLIRSEPEWQNVLAWDEFSCVVTLKQPFPGSNDTCITNYPRELQNVDITNIAVWLQEQHIRISSGVTLEALHVIASKNPFHPVREYLRGLKWDGVQRLDTWLIDHFGAEDTDLNRAIGARWCIGGVARIMRPGELVKSIPTFEGPQDINKSTALRTMAVKEEWFTDHLSDLDDKDSLLELQGIWILEFAEGATLNRAQASRKKAFLSTCVDKFRAPYEKLPARHPRQWIAAATLNDDGNGYLSDTTGEVRYWPVKCAVGWKPFRTFNIEALLGVRDQLWAEAVVRSDAGEPHWFHEENLKIAHANAADDRSQECLRENEVRQMLKAHNTKWFQMDSLLSYLGYVETRPDIERIRMKLGNTIHKLGWYKYRAQTDYAGPNGKGHYYFPPEITAQTAGVYAQKMTDELAANSQIYAKDTAPQRKPWEDGHNVPGLLFTEN